MKIIKIEQEGNIFTITKKPNIIEEFFDVKIKVERYQALNETYVYFENIQVYIDEKGDILGPTHEITKILENWKRRF